MQATLKSSAERRDDPRFDLIFECIGNHIKTLFRKYESNGQNGNRFFNDVVTSIRTFANGDEDVLAAMGYLDAHTLIQECRNRFNPPPPPAAKRHTPSPDVSPQTKTPPPEIAMLLDIFEKKLHSLVHAHRSEIMAKLSEGPNQAIVFLSKMVEQNDDFYKLRQQIDIRFRYPIIVSKVLQSLKEQKDNTCKI